MVVFDCWSDKTRHLKGRHLAFVLMFYGPSRRSIVALIVPERWQKSQTDPVSVSVAANARGHDWQTVDSV